MTGEVCLRSRLRDYEGSVVKMEIHVLSKAIQSCFGHFHIHRCLETGFATKYAVRASGRSSSHLVLHHHLGKVVGQGQQKAISPRGHLPASKPGSESIKCCISSMHYL